MSRNMIGSEDAAVNKANRAPPSCMQPIFQWENQTISNSEKSHGENKTGYYNKVAVEVGLPDQLQDTQ